MVGSSTILYKYRGPKEDSILPERPFLIGLHYKGGLYGISMGIHLRTFVYVLFGGPKWQQRTLILTDTVLFLQALSYYNHTSSTFLNPKPCTLNPKTLNP